MKRVVWVVHRPVEQVGGQLTSALASIRYRVLHPARHLAELGYASAFVPLGDRDRDSPRFRRELANGDIVVISKTFAAASVRLAEAAIAKGAAVVVDLCDDRFDHPDLGPIYLALLRRAHRIACSTPTLARAIRARSGREATVVEDPYEGEYGSPRFDPDIRRLRTLWFGHHVNFEAVATHVSELLTAARILPLRFEVVTGGNPQIAEFCAELTAATKGAIRAELIPWSVGATWRALAACDIVFLPSDPGGYRLAKSANRMIETLRAGRLAVAHPIPAYESFADFAWMGNNLAHGVSWALANGDDARRRIAVGQNYVEGKFAPRVIARQWAAFLDPLARGAVTAVPALS